MGSPKNNLRACSLFHAIHPSSRALSLAAFTSPIKDMVVSMTMVAAVMVSILAMVSVPSAMGTAVPRGSKSLHWKQKGCGDYENQG